jgi:putative acetyltransferase
MITVRPETMDDIPAIRDVNERAFEDRVEADLIDALRLRGAVTSSLVAVRGTSVVGHILFTPAEIVFEDFRLPAVALGPMAVVPDLQRTGIGTRLVEVGLESLRAEGHDIVIVLGHPEYYPRFGFVTARTRQIGCPYDAPDEAFMVLGLQPDTNWGKGGTARYQPEFDSA